MKIAKYISRNNPAHARRQRRDNIDKLLQAVQEALREDDVDWDGTWGDMGHLGDVEAALASAAQTLGVLSDEKTPELMTHYRM